MSNDTSLDWNALLQKTEEKITKLENFYNISDDSMTEIDKVRGVEHAYYEGEKEMKEAEEMISRMEEEGQAGTPEDRRHTSPVQGSKDAPPDVPEESMSPRARRLYQQFGGEKKEEDMCPHCGADWSDLDMYQRDDHVAEHQKNGTMKYEEEAKRLEEEIAGLGGLLE